MKSNFIPNPSKSEFSALQKENFLLRSQLKDLGMRLNILIELKDHQPSKRLTQSSTGEEELREAKKMIENYE
jgi:hypothetical protein